jgi:poly(A) polymerase
MVARIFRKMKLPSNAKMKYVAKLVGLHMRPQQVGEDGVTDSGIRRLSHDAGDDLADLMLLAEADLTSKNPEKVRRVLETFANVRTRLKEVNEADDFRKWENPINGNLIMDLLVLPGGKEIGELKESIKSAILGGEIENDFTAAFELLLKVSAERGFEIKDNCEDVRKRYKQIWEERQQQRKQERESEQAKRDARDNELGRVR